MHISSQYIYQIEEYVNSKNAFFQIFDISIHGEMARPRICVHFAILPQKMPFGLKFVTFDPSSRSFKVNDSESCPNQCVDTPEMYKYQKIHSYSLKLREW